MPNAKAIGSSKSQIPKGYTRTMVDELLKPDNRSLLTAVGLFATAVVVLHSGLAEFLVPT